MARVTVEDCLKNVKNRFELVIVAARRARQLMRGKEPHVPWDNDKSTVVALREIAEGFVDFTAKEKEENREESQLFTHKRENDNLHAIPSAADAKEEKEDDDEKPEAKASETHPIPPSAQEE